MIKNYLKIAFRNLVKQKYYSLINIFGLAFGIASSVLIFLWVSHESSFDKFHEKHENIYRITSDASMGGQEFNICYAPSGCALKLAESCPEVEMATIMTPYQNVVYKYDNNYYKEKKVIATDSCFFKLFNFQFLEGNAENPFPKQNSIVITKSIAKKYFGNEESLGKVLLTNGENPAVISAVIEDLPSNSHMQFSIATYMENDNNWDNFNSLIYVLLKNNFSQNNVNNSLKEIENYIVNLMTQSFGMSTEQFNKAGNYIKLDLQPLTAIHLNSNFYGELETNGNKTYVIFFSIIAILILFIASINYMNLSTAYYDTRAVEIGIRKANGARRGMLIRQFSTESILISIASFIVGILLIKLSLPLFNHYIAIDINEGIYNNWYFILLVFALVMILSFISGLYPAAYISRVNTISILSNKSISPVKKAFNTRSALVVFQYTIAIVVIVATILVKKQVDFLLNKDLGFKSEQLVVIEGANDLGDKKEVFKTELKKNSQIINLCTSDVYPGGKYTNITGYNVDGYPPEQQFVLKTIFADADYFDTYGMKILSGRKFNSTDKPAMILNEKAVELMKLNDPLSNRIIGNNQSFPILGVVKNFNHDPLKVNLDPILIRFVDNQNYDFITIRLAEGNAKDAMSFITNKWNELSGDKPFEYYFLDSKLESAYKAEMKAGNVLTLFSLLSVIIACMGILGIASFSIQRRIKEIGIRKVNGAKDSEVLTMLNKDFAKWVFIAFVLATPISWYAMYNWLESFAYKTELSWWIFALAGLLALGIALLTVSWQSWKAATRNPVEALRYE